MNETIPPTGRRFPLQSGAHRAVVEERGATLAAYEVDGRPVVEPFDGEPAPAVSCRGEVLAPWPNRVVDGRWSWAGAEHRLALSEPERGHALHGLVRDVAWTLVEHRPDEVTFEVLVLAHPGWPYPFTARITYRLSDTGLAVTLTAGNVGTQPMPYGAGFHPYLAVVGGPLGAATLDLAARTYLATDDRLAPTGARPTRGGDYELSGGPLGARRLDTAYTDLEGRSADGSVQAVLTAPDGRQTVVWGDETVRWWQVFTGDGLPAPWNRCAVAVEPMTCGPDAFNTGRDLVVLEPGAQHVVRWGIALR